MFNRSNSGSRARSSIGRTFTVFAAFFLSQSAVAQTQATTGNINGRVYDLTGVVVPNVELTARNQDTGFSRNSHSNEDGAFILILLPPGVYTVSTAAAQGFAPTEIRNIPVNVGASRNLDITLVRGPSVNVDVTSGSGGLEPSRTSIVSTIDRGRIENLPGLLRNFQENAMRTPGIVRDKTRGGDFSTGGQKGSFNSLQVDGVSNDNTYFAQAVGRVGADRIPFQFSEESVKEYQISKAGFSAEFGRAPGAVINVVTRSGSNRFTGVGFFFFRDEALTANSPRIKADQALAGLPNKRVAQQADELGFAFGGPIKKDKAFFFVSINHRSLTFTNAPFLRSLQFAPQNVQQLISPKLIQYCPCGPNDAFLFKTDVNLNERNQLSVRSNVQRANMQDYSNQRSNAPLENDGSFVVKTFSTVAGLTSTLRKQTFNEFRFQYLRDREYELPNSTIVGLTLNAANAGGFNDGTFNIGGNTALPREVTIDRVQFVDNLTRILGAHAIKIGADLLFDRIYALNSSFSGGSYAFSGYPELSNQLNSTSSQFAARYRQSFFGPETPGPVTHPNDQEYGLYIQDEWRANPRLTLNIGLRYDFQKIPSPKIRNENSALLAAGYDTSFVPADRNDLAPRFGASYGIDSRTVFRIGYGMFFGRTPSVVTATAHSQNGIQSRLLDVNCTNNPGLCPIYPLVFSSLPISGEQVPFNVFLFDRQYSQPFTHQAHVELEREIIPGTTLSVQYALFRGADLSRTRNANLDEPVPATYPVFVQSTPTGQTFTFQRFSRPRPIPAFQQINLFESTAKSFYQGLSFVFTRRATEKLWFYVHYTLSKAEDDRPDQIPGSPNSIIENAFDLRSVYGRSDLDLRHRFIFSEGYRLEVPNTANWFVKILLNGLTLSGTFTMQSGLPYSANVGNDPNGDLVTVLDILPGTTRNQFSTPWVYILDARLTRKFHFGEHTSLTLIANGFNVFNRVNVLLANETVYNFSDATASLPPRLTPVANFGTPRVFVSATQGTGPAISTSNRSFQLGLKLEF